MPPELPGGELIHRDVGDQLRIGALGRDGGQEPRGSAGMRAGADDAIEAGDDAQVIAKRLERLAESA